MSVDLTLMPLLSRDSFCAHQMVAVERRPELWPEIEKLPHEKMQAALACYVSVLPDGERGYGNATETPYGDPITFTTAGDLLSLKNHKAVQDCWQNRAAWAWLAHYPKDWPIVLWWR